MKKKNQSRRTNSFLSTLIFILIIVGITITVTRVMSNAEPLSKSFSQSVNQNNRITATEPELEFPLPLADRKEQIIRHTGYSVSYNVDWKIPNWVAYELTGTETQGYEKRKDRFTEDPLTEGSDATNSDYSHSGYDKGHMAPAADMRWSSNAMKESFYFSNVCPQYPQLNRGKWKILEEQIRDIAVQDSAIIIVCGPIVNINHKTIGSNNVAVPEYFFKVILSPYVSSPRAIGFIFKNENATASVRQYAVSVDSIEKLTGMDFFSKLPDNIENRIEATIDASAWGL